MLQGMRVYFDPLPIFIIFTIGFGVFFWLARDSFKSFGKRKPSKTGQDKPESE